VAAVNDRSSAVDTLDVSVAPDEVRKLLDRVIVDGRTVIIEQRGQEVAALVSVADLERLRSLDRQRTERISVIEEIHRRNRDLDPDEAEQDIAEEIAAMRAEGRARAATPSRT
jgi:prevent-host-death family protein